MGNVIQNFSSHEAEKISSSSNSNSIKVKRALDQLAYLFRIRVI